MRNSKKFISVILAVLMVVAMMPFSALTASAADEPYLTFRGTDSFSIKTNNNARNWNGTLQYSTDTNTWTTWDGTSQISSANNKLYLRGTGNTQITGSNGDYKTWVITTQGTVACSGDIRTLLDYTDPDGSSMGTYCFAYLFNNCTSLTTAPDLPATILADSCYAYMFNGCTSLRMAPELEATTLARHCYQAMFNGCTSLTTAPELWATSLAEDCYGGMFQNCTNLTTAPELPATSLAPSCYSLMFSGCRSLTTAPVLPATSLANACYYYMFSGCANLTTAPELPAITLMSSCYESMFSGCANLTTAPELPATTLANFCYRSMFQNCTSLTTPSELPATSLKYSCYESMFKGCTGIKLSTEQTAEYSIPYSIPKEGTGSLGSSSLSDMFSNTGGAFKGTPTINTTYYLAAPAPTGVAAIGNVGYPTLEDAIAAAQSGDTITLLDDITGNFTIPAGLDVSLDLNDYTITTSNTSTPVITNRGTLDVYGGTLVNNGLYFPDFLGDGGVAVMNYGVATVNVTTNKGAIVNRSTSSTTPNLTVEGGTYVGNPLALSSEDNSYTVINGGNFTGGSSFVRANSGATTEVNDGNFVCLGTESESNWIVNGGNVDAITVDGGSEDISITVSGGEIKQLPSTSAVNNSTNVSVEVSGGTFNSVVPAEYCANGYIPVTEPNAQGKYTVEQAEVAANFTLDGSVNFNLYLDKDYPADYTVDLTYNHASNVSETAAYATDSVTLADLDVYSGPESGYQGYYTFSIKQAPAQIGDDITIAIKNTNGTTVYSNTVQTSTLCKERAAATDGNLKALYEAIVDYGKASQAYFGGSAVADSYYNDAVTTLTTIPSTGGGATLAVTGVSLVVTSELGINIYTSDLVTVNSVSTAGNSAITAEAGYGDTTDTPVIVVRGIAASDLGDNFTVSTSGGDITMSAYTVARSILASSTDTNYQNLARAMYLYGEAAAAYFA